MGWQQSAKKVLTSAKNGAVNALGEDGAYALKNVGNSLRAAGKQAMNVAAEVSEDCDNEVLKNARDFYTGAAKKAGKALRAGIRSAEEYSLKDEEPKTLREDLAETGTRLAELAKEVAEDNDTEVLQNAREFYTDTASALQNNIRQKTEKARLRSEKRRIARAAARRRRAALRSKLARRGTVVVIGLILAASLLITLGLWFSKHNGKPAAQARIPEDVIATETQPTVMPEVPEIEVP